MAVAWAGTADIVLEKMFPKADPHLADPVAWVEERLNEYLWRKQREIIESVRDNRYTAVQSCHDIGKSFIASRCMAWWEEVHPTGSAFSVSTAPTYAQVNAILWRELRRCHRAANLKGQITLDNQWSVDGELIAYGRKPADYDQAAFQGIHARYVLAIVDEACGVPQSLFEAVDSIVTNANSRVLAIGNPDDPASYFAKICAPGSGWNVLKVSWDDVREAILEGDIPDELQELLISEQWVEERKRRWGVDSPIYTSKVLGEFPEVSDDTLISPRLIREAQQRDLSDTMISDPGRYGVDIARLGSDQTVAYEKRGGVVRLLFAHAKKDTMQTAGVIAQHLNERHGKVHAVLDVIGVGAGVYDRLNERGLPVVPCNVASRASDPRKFKNLRAEIFWGLREAFEDGLIDLDEDDDELASQLVSLRWWVDSSGRIVIESKDEMKKRGMPSPDRADALAMVWWEPAMLPLVQHDEDDLREGITDDLLERPL